MRSPGVGAQITGMPSTIGVATTFTGTTTFNKTAEASAGETLSTWTVSDDATSAVQIFNSSTTNGVFNPGMLFKSTTTNIAADFRGSVGSDSGSSPAIRFRTYTTSGATALATRPTFAFTNGATDVLTGLPLNSGANLALSWGTQTGALPTWTTSRSIGTRAIWYNSFSNGAAADYSTGVDVTNGILWDSLPVASSSYSRRIYGGNGTLAHTFRADGLADHVGAVRATGVAAPATGVGVEMLYGVVANTGDVISYDRGGAAWKDMRVRGLTVALQASGTTVLTGSATAVTAAVPMGLPSYTVATLPSAATAGQLIYVSNEAGGAVIAFSDGTNWRRVTDRAIVS